VKREENIVHVVEQWLQAFNAALGDPQAGRIAGLFLPESHWREALALSWRLQTVSGNEAIGSALAEGLSKFKARDFAIDPKRCQPRVVERGGVKAIEAILHFETAVGRGAGIVRIPVEGAAGGVPLAWTLYTALEEIRGHEEPVLRAQREDPVFSRDFHGPTWLEKRESAREFKDREPVVLVVGGGHAGLGAAARLGQLGIDTLVVDRMQRIGDNWRKRYSALKLHNTNYSNHLPYMPFPPTFQRYLPKDRIANWLETYVDCLDIAFWTETEFEKAQYDEASSSWKVFVDRKGEKRVLRPRHVILATSVSGAPNIPQIPTLERFGGKVLHSSRFGNGAQWRGRNVLVIGTGTSAHDIAQDLHGHGARTTMVQRSPTLVSQVEPSAQLYDGIYLGEGPSLEDRDLINTSIPKAVMLATHRRLTDQAREHDKPLMDALEKVGFRLSWGFEGTGWPYLFRTRGGGYYFNVGCSDLLASGEVGLIQYHDIESFVAEGAKMKDGRVVKADLVVLATGYKGLDHMVRTRFGDTVADRVGPIWGFDERTQELRNMWSRTGQPGLWFTGGPFSACRAYSKYLALQIKAMELGILSG
jgi:cation diffusion facilitator CzcD-associated flavoprotein CzcO